MTAHDRPTPQELAEAVREFLQSEILPILDDHRLKFRTLVAINGLGIAERELWATATPRDEDWELARRIRAGDGPNRATRIIGLTAAAGPVFEAQCRAAGMDDYLSKPVQRAVLLEQLGLAAPVSPP